MVLVKRLRRTLLFASLFVLVSLLLGKYVVSSIIGTKLDNAGALLTGAAIISVCGHLFIFGYAIWANSFMGRRIRDCFPEDAHAMRLIGVSTPTEYAYVVSQILTYVPISYYSNMLQHPDYVYNRRLYRKARLIFVEMFGREPIQGKSDDWGFISACELADQLKVDIDTLSFEILEENVSDQVRQYINEKRYFRN